MTSCIRCREPLSMPDANYCGNCSFPILNTLDEDAVRERAQEEHRGFLDGFDFKTILDSLNEEQDPPADAYQWYLEEGVKKVLMDLALLQRWDWFDKDPISGLFFQDELFDEDPPDDAINDYVVWARVSAFFYEAFQPAGLELSIRLGAFFAEGLDPTEDIDVSIAIDADDEPEANPSGPAS